MGGPLDMTVIELLQHWAKFRPDRPALIFHHPYRINYRFMFTFRELYTLGSRCAYLLMRRGVRRQSVLLVLLPNSPERAIVEVAALLLGAFTVTATCQEKGGEDLLALVKETNPACVVMDMESQGEAWEALRTICQLMDTDTGIVVSAHFPDLHFVLRIRRIYPPTERDFICYLRYVQKQEYTMKQPSSPQDPCAILSARGSLGDSKKDAPESPRTQRRRKLVVQSHRNMVAFSKVFMPTTDSPRPMYFLNYPFGNVRGHLAVSLCTPVTRILLDDWDGLPDNLGELIFRVLTDEQCLIAVLHPAVIDPMAKLFKASPDTPKLFILGLFGEATDNSLLEKAFDVSHMVLVNFVSAELLLVSVDILTDATMGSCGQPIQPGVLVHTRALDDPHSIQEPGEPGIVHIRTPLMFMKYLRDPQRTRDCLTEDGFFRTGKLGQVKNNCLFVDKNSFKNDNMLNSEYISDLQNI